MDSDQIAINRLLESWGVGDRASLDQLMGLVYHELHRTASSILQDESTTNRTRPTSLVNALYLELQRQGRLQAQGQKHFFAIAAYLMRQILVSDARRRQAEKRGAKHEVVSLSSEMLAELVEDGIDWRDNHGLLLGLHAALQELEKFDPLKASIVDLRFFADLSIEETAKALDLSPATVKRHWAVARLWLIEHLGGAKE